MNICKIHSNVIAFKCVIDCASLIDFSGSPCTTRVLQIKFTRKYSHECSGTYSVSLFDKEGKKLNKNKIKFKGY